MGNRLSNQTNYHNQRNNVNQSNHVSSLNTNDLDKLENWLNKWEDHFQLGPIAGCSHFTYQDDIRRRISRVRVCQSKQNRYSNRYYYR